MRRYAHPVMHRDVRMPRSDDGRKMLKQNGFERFDPATAAVYIGQAGTLKEYWGY